MLRPMSDILSTNASGPELIAQGFAALGRESYKEAAAYARAGLAAAPGDPGALTLLGRLAMLSCRPDVAHDLFRQLAMPGAPAATWLDMARAHLDLRQETQALTAAELAAEAAPQSAEAWFMIGETATMLNDISKAGTALRRVLALAPEQTDAFPRLCRLGLATDAELAHAEERLRLPGLKPADAANLHYGLASARRRQNRDKDFITHLLAANQAQRSAYSGPLPDLKATNDRLISIFNRGAFSRAARASKIGPMPIFIVGMPRSGTTLVEQIVTGAPGVASGGELKYYRDILPGEVEAMTGKRFPEGFDTLSSEQMEALAAPLARLFVVMGVDAPRMTDKTLDNFQRIGLLLHMFPDAKVICLRRDPMDTCFSILQQQFAPTIVQTFDLELMAQACRRFADIVDHWRGLFNDRFLEVQYERLVADPKTEARRVIEYCGFEWSDDLLDFHQREGAVRTFSDQQVRQPISQGSVGAWRPFAAELAPLRRALDANGVRYAS